MDAAKKNLRITQCIFAHLKDQIQDLTKQKLLNIETLSKLEAILFEYRSIKETFEKQTEEILLLMDEDAKGYTQEV